MIDRCNGSGQAVLFDIPTVCGVCGAQVEVTDCVVDEHAIPLPPVLAAHRWPSNAELILDCRRLGYLRDEWRTLDPTAGRLTWWKLWRPTTLICHDKDLDGTDFRKLDYPDDHFDAIAYDPPFVCKGGRATSGITEMDERYGQDDAPATPALLQGLINDGLTEMYRLVHPGGIVLVKVMDYVSSGKLFEGTFFTRLHAGELGFKTFDRFEYIGTPGPQPPGRRQVHARNNVSTLFVFRKPGRQRSNKALQKVDDQT